MRTRSDGRERLPAHLAPLVAGVHTERLRPQTGRQHASVHSGDAPLSRCGQAGGDTTERRSSHDGTTIFSWLISSAPAHRGSADSVTTASRHCGQGHALLSEGFQHRAIRSLIDVELGLDDVNGMTSQRVLRTCWEARASTRRHESHLLRPAAIRPHERRTRRFSFLQDSPRPQPKRQRRPPVQALPPYHTRTSPIGEPSQVWRAWCKR